MSPAELGAFWNWFLAEKAHRIEMLEMFVRESQDWSADFTKKSLRPLMRWFMGVASSGYADRIKAGVPPEDAAEWKGTWLRNKYTPSSFTISVAFDIGIYLGKTIIRNAAGAEWVHCVRPKNDVYYGQPCIKGVCPTPWSPMPSCVGVAADIICDRADEGALDVLYEYMVENF